MNKETSAGDLVSLTPEIVMPEGSVRRNSTGKILSKASNSLSGSGEKRLPHYLRASTSSCHDFCKYGREHVFDKKGKSPVLPKFSNGKPASGKEEDPNRLNEERGKKPVLKLKASPKSKPKINGRTKPIRNKIFAPILADKSAEASSEEINNSAFLLKEIESSEERNTVEKSDVSHDIADSIEEAESFFRSSLVKEVEKELEIIEQSPEQQSSVYKNDPSKQPQTNKLVGLVEKTETSEHSENRKQGCLPMQKATFAAKPKLKQEMFPTVRKSVASAKPRMSKQTPMPPTRKIDATVKSAKSVKSKTKIMKPIIPEKLKSSLNPPRGLVTRSMGGTSKDEGKKILSLSKASLSSLKPPIIKGPNIRSKKPGVSRSSPSMKNQKKAGDYNATEKTLYVIEPKAEDVILETRMSIMTSPQSRPSSMSSSSSSLLLSSSVPLSRHGEEEQEDSEYTYSEESDVVSEDGTGDEQATDVNNKDRRLSRSSKLQPQEEDSAAYKLKFRRGKVVNLQAKDSGPRRLRFGKGRVFSESQSGKGEAQRRSYRMKAEIVGEDTNETNPEAKTVVLRHQGMQGKKDTRGLLNHVIEETASKLVETRKSKVKALVGAFETVISLQESKPALAV